MDFVGDCYPRTPSTLSPRSTASGMDAMDEYELHSPQWPTSEASTYEAPTMFAGSGPPHLDLELDGLTFAEYTQAHTMTQESDVSTCIAQRSSEDLLELLKGNSWPEALALLSGRVVEISARDKAGSQAVQYALAHCGYEATLKILNEIKGNVVAMICCLHGNHVLASALDTMPAPDTYFIIEEVMPYPEWLASHKFGIRIFQRLVMQHHTEDQAHILGSLLDAIVENTGRLSVHAFGNFAIQQILQYCPKYSKQVVHYLVQYGLMRLALSPYGTNVIQSALVTTDESEQHLLAGKLLSCQENIDALRKNEYGRRVMEILQRYFAVTIMEQERGKAPESSIPWQTAEAFRENCQKEVFCWEAYAGQLCCISMMSPVWSRKLQDAIRAAAKEDPDRCACILTAQLERGGSALEMAISPHGNFVLDLACTELPKCFGQRVATSLQGALVQASTNVYAYRTIQTLLRRVGGAALHRMVEEILGKPLQLSLDKYGNFVLQDTVKKCQKWQFERLIADLRPHAATLWEDKHASHVIQCLLRQKRKLKNVDMKAFRQAGRHGLAK